MKNVITTLMACFMGVTTVLAQTDSTDDTSAWLIKVNLIGIGAGIANAGAECAIGDKFSIEAMLACSPYRFSRTFMIRTIAVQPEFKWWPNESLEGHYIGLHAHLASFDVAFDGDTRYQDADGRKPLWGLGLSYGYVIGLPQNLSIEFTAGLGYARLCYDMFYNVPNGARYDSRARDYWGLTKAGILIAYQF